MKITVAYTHVMESERNPAGGVRQLDGAMNAGLIQKLGTDCPELTDAEVTEFYNAAEVSPPCTIDDYVMFWSA